MLFQPHRYSRTLHLLDDFARAFHQADRVCVMDIYAASEKPIEGVTSQALVERMRQFGHKGAEYAGSNEAGVAMVAEGASRGRHDSDPGRGKCFAAGEKILERL